MAITKYGIITLTANAAANTKGAYVQIVASTPYDSSRLYLMGDFGAGVTTGRLYLLDIAKGAAASETVIVSNIAVHTDGDQMNGCFTVITVDVPAGTRLSARLQSPTGSAQSSYYFYLEDRALASLANPETSGSVTASSRGTVVDPGAAANIKGAYVELSASTAQRTDALLVCTTMSAQGTNVTTEKWKIDVATGGSGSEVVVLPDLPVVADTTLDTIFPTLIRLPISIPAGTRLAVRAECSGNTSPERLIAVTLIGMQDVPEGGGNTVASRLAGAYVG